MDDKESTDAAVRRNLRIQLGGPIVVCEFSLKMGVERMWGRFADFE